MLKKNGIFQNDVVLWNLLNGKERTVHVKESKEMTRLHMLRENSGWLNWCFVWYDYLVLWYLIFLFVRIKKTENKSKEGNCGVLTFFTHLGQFFSLQHLSVSGKRRQAWEQNQWIEFPSGPKCSYQRDPGDGKRWNCCQKKKDRNWDCEGFSPKNLSLLLGFSVTQKLFHTHPTSQSWAVYSAGCTSKKGLMSPWFSNPGEIICTRKNREKIHWDCF